MSDTYQSLLDDVDLRYRNTFTANQKIVWLTEEQRELFDLFAISAAPIGFSLINGVEIYEIPEGIDIERIQTLTVQVNDSETSPEFQELPFKRDNQSSDGMWYSVVGETFFINIPGGAKDDRIVYIFHDSPPPDVTSSDLASEPATPKKYREILKLGVLKRIAQARKDVTMANNYAMERETKIDDMLWAKQMNEPEFMRPTDVMPRRNGHGRTVAITLSSESN